MPKVGMEPIRRDQIRRAAAKLIAKHGFDRTTLRHVAQAAKISTGMINHYYPNKIALLVDVLLVVSEWFQSELRKALATTKPGVEQFLVFLRVGVFHESPEAMVGHKVWAWAMAQSIHSKELMQVIQKRRALFEDIIFDVLRQLDTDIAIGEAEIRELAAELDSYVNGVGLHIATGATNLDARAIERSLLAMVMARLRGQDWAAPPSFPAGERERRPANTGAAVVAHSEYAGTARKTTRRG
jgi:TetR/AcrR family transcriptional regulator, transcriptional repressor of bet genes